MAMKGDRNLLRPGSRTGAEAPPLGREEILENYEFYNGDHWNVSIFKERSLIIETELQRQQVEEFHQKFQSDNVLKDIVERKVNGLLGEDPSWFFADEDMEPLESVPGGIDKILQRFLRSQKLLSSSMFAGKGSKNCLEKAITNAYIGGKGYVRLYDPQRFNIPLLMHSPDPFSVVIGRDGNGLPTWIRYTYTLKNDETQVEHQMIDETTGFTVFRTLEGHSSNYVETFGIDHETGFEEGSVIDQWEMDLGGSYSIYEIALEPMINKDNKRSQKAINQILTLSLNNVMFTIPRDSVLNGLPPGKFTTNEQGQIEYVRDEKLEYVPPGSTTYISGYPIFGGNLGEGRGAGKKITGYTNPSVHTHTPFETTYFSENLEQFRLNIYRRAKQEFVLRQVADKEKSGVAHKILRDDFMQSMQKDSTTIIECLKTVYKTSIFMLNQASLVTRTAIKNTELVVELNLTISDILPDDKRVIIEEYNANLVSQFTAINQLGYEAEEEIPKIEAELEQRAELMQETFDSDAFPQPNQGQSRSQENSEDLPNSENVG
ncbi:MAG: hypothetical protein F6J98_02125 [Moorea sp. SIO4G2]|nr:hypothetical protein [Moorena sp. SIO4G2]